MLVRKIDDLVIYKKALALASKTMGRVKHIPYYWSIPEGKQLIRASASPASNIAEGFSQRFYPKQFIRYLNIALGSSDECQNHIKKLILDNYISKEVGEPWSKEFKSLSISTLNFINYLRKSTTQNKSATGPPLGPQ